MLSLSSHSFFLYLSPCSVGNHIVPFGFLIGKFPVLPPHLLLPCHCPFSAPNDLLSGLMQEPLNQFHHLLLGSSVNPHQPHFTDEDTETQSGPINSPKSHSW